MSQVKVKGGIYPSSTSLFYLGPQWIGLNDTCLHWWGQIFTGSTDLMLISSRNTLMDTPGNTVLPAIWASLSLVKLIHQIYHHNNDNVMCVCVCVCVCVCNFIIVFTVFYYLTETKERSHALKFFIRICKTKIKLKASSWFCIWFDFVLKSRINMCGPLPFSRVI